jgi:hypothetical protein
MNERKKVKEGQPNVARGGSTAWKRFTGYIKKHRYIMLFAAYAVSLMIAQTCTSFPDTPNLGGPADAGFKYCLGLAKAASLSSMIGYASGILTLLLGICFLLFSSLPVDNCNISDCEMINKYRSFVLMVLGAAGITVGGLFILRAGDDVELSRTAQTLLFFKDDVNGKMELIDDSARIIRCSNAKAVWLAGRAQYSTFQDKMNEVMKNNKKPDEDKAKPKPQGNQNE